MASAGAVATHASPASAATKFDGVWTIDHGATGQVVFNGDYTYTTTCQPIAKFPATNCPSRTGTFSWSYTSVYLTLTGSDGRAMSFRMSGPATAPDSLSGGGGAGTYSGIIDRGMTFKCSTFYDSTYAFAKGSARVHGQVRQQGIRARLQPVRRFIGQQGPSRLDPTGSPLRKQRPRLSEVFTHPQPQGGA